VVFQRHDRATLIVADPPRHSWLALWNDNPVGLGDDPNPAKEGEETVEVVALVEGVAVARKVRARRVCMRTAIDALLELPASADVTPSVHGWARTTAAAVDLISRGQIRPGVSASGLDTWEIGERTPVDDELRSNLAASLPTIAFATPIAGHDDELHVMEPDAAIDAFTAAVADAMPRTQAASRVTGARAWAAHDATAIEDVTAEWLESLSPRRSDAALTLRIAAPEPGVERFYADLIVRSRSDREFSLDAQDYWSNQSEHAVTLGSDAADDILLTLRRGSQSWQPLTRLLAEKSPSRLELLDNDIGELLGDGAQDLALAGISVDWPRAQFSHLQLVPIITTTEGDSGEDDDQPGALSLQGLAQLRWEGSVEGEALSSRDLDRLLASTGPLLAVGDRWVRIDQDQLDQLREERELTASEALAIALGGAAAPDGSVMDAQVTGPIAELANRLASLDSKPDAEAVGFNGELRDYQLRGLTWLAEMTDLGLGGVLADDMGLGKTIQVLALHLARADALGPTLVVCPATLIANWEREAERFAPGIPVRRFHGAERNLDDLEPNEIVVATYGLVRRDADLLSETEWGLVIADEAQAVKNAQSRTARELRRMQASARFALTGTPVENHLSDLWSLLDWTTPGLLGPQARFRREVALPIERHRDAAKSESFARLVAPFVLRRRKSDPEIAPELPAKTETDHFVSLTEEQAEMYRSTTDRVMSEVSAASGIARRGLVLKLITELKQICNHPAHYLRQSGPLKNRSGKLDAVDELVDVIVEEGDKTLIFTQYVEMGARLDQHFSARGLTTAFLHGSVPVVRRQSMVDAFQNDDIDVFVLSLKAGGTGLNLTAATHVIHYDRWWNPAVEDQASDRAWRIGQDRPVQVHRMVCEGTLEDRIAAIINEKRQLAESIVGGSEAWISELDDDELTDLVELSTDALSAGDRL